LAGLGIPAGETDHRRWSDTLQVGAAFHQRWRTSPRPAFLDERDDPWTFAERLAWGEVPVGDVETMAEVIEPLVAACRRST
jgi:hypothetical protein